jgi:hypothetical protein
MYAPRDTYSFFRVAGWNGAWSPWSFQGGYLATYNESSYSGKQDSVKVNSMSEGTELSAEGGENYAVVKWENSDWTPVYANTNPVFMDTEVLENQANYYAVFANKSGEWEALNGYGFIQVNSPPAKPKHLKAIPNSFTVQLTWDPVIGGSTISYRIFLDGKQVAETKETSYTIAGLKDNSTYSVSVRAVNNKLSAQSTPAKAKVTTLPFSMKTYTYHYENNRLKSISENGVIIMEFFYDYNDKGGNITSKIVKQ